MFNVNALNFFQIQQNQLERQRHVNQVVSVCLHPHNPEKSYNQEANGDVCVGGPWLCKARTGLLPPLEKYLLKITHFTY